MSSSKDVGRMAREVEEYFGRIDLLVNNTGSMVERLKISEMTEEVWDRVMA